MKEPLRDQWKVSDDGFDRLLDELSAAPTLPIHPPAQPGTVVDDKFELLGILARSGMGVVYLARDLMLDREVALKMINIDRLRAHRQMVLEAFEREARATARLQHHNVVTLFQCGYWGDQLYFVLERLRGATLADRLARGPLTIEMIQEDVANGEAVDARPPATDGWSSVMSAARWLHAICFGSRELRRIPKQRYGMRSRQQTDRKARSPDFHIKRDTTDSVVGKRRALAQSRQQVCNPL